VNWAVDMFRTLLAALLILQSADGWIKTKGTYPTTTLKCYSTFLKGATDQLTCPEARSNFCVKEVSTLRQDLCGHTQYFGDQYILNVCVTRKCAAECKDESWQFDYGDLTYTRSRTCCKTNYCNSGFSLKRGTSAFTLACVAALSALLLLNN